MNINYKTHLILEPLNRLKNKNKTAIAGVTQITQHSARQEVYINLEEFIELLNFNNINVYGKNLFEKVVGQQFDFFKYFDTFFKNNNLSDTGIIVTNKISYVYCVKKTKNEYFFSFYEIAGQKDYINILCYSWGEIKIKNNKYKGNLTQSKDLAKLTDCDFDWDLNFDKAFHGVMAIIFNHIIFKKFAPIETKQIITSDKTRYRTYKPNKNKSGLKINYITSQWFTNLERSGAFGVKGHWRLQACGEGMKDRKLIWIKDFIKEGYTKRAQRLIEEEKLNS